MRLISSTSLHSRESLHSIRLHRCIQSICFTQIMHQNFGLQDTMLDSGVQFDALFPDSDSH